MFVSIVKARVTSTCLLSLAAVAACLVVLPARTRAASIGVSFSDGEAVALLTTTASAGAAPYAQTHYNNVTSNPTNLVLNDDAGFATPVQITLAGASLTHLTSGSAGPDEILNNGVSLTLDAQSFTLTGIPYARYTLVVYALTLAAYTQAVAVGGTTYYLRSPDAYGYGHIDYDPATAFVYTQATSTNPAAPTNNGDYMVFTGLSGSTQTIVNTRLTGTFANIAGFQIIQVPEPGTWAAVVVGVGLLGVVALRRRVVRAWGVAASGEFFC